MGEIIDLAAVDWQREADIYGEAGEYMASDRVLDLAVTPLAAGGARADVIDGDTVVWREWRPTVSGAKAAAMAAARQIVKAEAA